MIDARISGLIIVLVSVVGMTSILIDIFQTEKPRPKFKKIKIEEEPIEINNDDVIFSDDVLDN